MCKVLSQFHSNVFHSKQLSPETNWSEVYETETGRKEGNDNNDDYNLCEHFG